MLYLYQYIEALNIQDTIRITSKEKFDIEIKMHRYKGNEYQIENLFTLHFKRDHHLLCKMESLKCTITMMFVN